MVDQETRELVARALAEDVGAGDLTADAVVPARAAGRGRIVQKAPGVVFGLEVAAEVFRQAGAGGLEALTAEGEWHERTPVDVAAIVGPARVLLGAERTALNFLCHLSGVATLTARYVDASAGRATILDTRKTLPGLRRLEKAAVAAAGGANHRMGLDDAILIKENHIAFADGLGAAVRAARAAGSERAVEVECRDLEEVAEAIAAGADRVLLDNMSPKMLREAVAVRARAAPDGSRPELEASGGVTLENVAQVAASGVEFVSIGALTHSAPALDLSMLMELA